jgi:hypothetical protein
LIFQKASGIVEEQKEQMFGEGEREEILKMYVIQDSTTGNYLSPASFQKVDYGGKKWLYITYTGRTTGFTSYSNKDQAEKVFTKLNEIKQKINTNKTLELIEIDVSKITKGVKLAEEI